MNVSPELPLVLSRLRSRLEGRVATTNEICHEGTRNGPGRTDFARLFLSHLHVLDVALVLVIADGRDAEICHTSLPKVDSVISITNMAA
ncbi:hypothetical protein Aave_0678 [Paracidovorax citrulli AAC00-1]|uniref:Uncharacterized protein n=1 Tax=Paracidovorax citrulli (strain AAC00-1) TaxID=397945 RepID=A1TJZ1_PARC0|nr:hypothetical protein Aave_0678 [Paracidovorax citrulli AAC00-1]